MKDLMKKYNIIYANQPWSYNTFKDKENGVAKKHYSTMTKKDLKELPIQDITADDCVLFMWVTMPCLEQGLELIKEWGFTYKTNAFTWVKRNKKEPSWFWGSGHYTRANAELCLLATKGRTKRISASVHSIIDMPIQEHSKKPSVAREKIVELFGDLPRIELFARESVEGWDCWENEVEGL